MENMLLFEQILGKGKKMNESLISINEEFISEEEHFSLLNIAIRLTENNLWTKNSKDALWSDRFFNLIYLNYEEYGFGLKEDKEIYLKVLAIRQRIKNKIIEFMGLDHEIYADSLQLNRWRPGDLQMPHADGEMEDGSEHPFAWREYGCVLYLNNEYEGGNIYFPQWDIEMKPKPRMLAFFPGTLDYMHGVMPITSGMRYTLSSFWSSDKTKSFE
jgi:hypothetical protein